MGHIFKTLNAVILGPENFPEPLTHTIRTGTYQSPRAMVLGQSAVDRQPSYRAGSMSRQSVARAERVHPHDTREPAHNVNAVKN